MGAPIEAFTAEAGDGRILIEAAGLRRAFGDLAAVDGLSLSVAGGEIYGLIGPDGAGKTTTLRLLCGALTPDAGRVALAGLDLARQTEEARAQVGYLAQRFSLYGDLTVRENLRFFAEVRGLSRAHWETRTTEILAFVGLDEFADRRAEALSGGMKQKLGLATALVHQPRILLLDEPTSGVDPVTRQSFWQLLVRLLREGVCILLTTPYMDEASRCSRVGFMEAGRLLVEGPPSEIAAQLEGRVLELVGGPRRLVETLAAQDPGIESLQSYGDRFQLRVAPDQAGEVQARLARALRSSGGTVERLRVIRPGLEDVFIQRLERSRLAGDQAQDD